jgi:hypothetical protein
VAGGATNKLSVPELAWQGFLRKLDKIDSSYKS